MLADLLADLFDDLSHLTAGRQHLVSKEREIWLFVGSQRSRGEIIFHSSAYLTARGFMRIGLPLKLTRGQ